MKYTYTKTSWEKKMDQENAIVLSTEMLNCNNKI